MRSSFPSEKLTASCIMLVLTVSAGCGGGGNGGGGGNSPANATSGTSDSGAVDTGVEPSQMSATDREAADFLRAKIDEHWVKGPDGWTTQLQRFNIGGEVIPGEPDTLYRQIRDIKFTIVPERITESQRLNRADYRAEVSFAKSPERTYRKVDNFEGAKGWTMWAQSQPSFGLAMERRNGKWLMTEDVMFDGLKPDASAVPAGK